METQKTAFDGETDADLLTMIGWRQEDETVAREAWAVLYNRHFKFLAAACLDAYRKQIGDAGVEDLVSDTFLQVYLHGAETFRTDESDPEIIRKLVRAWLCTVAHNLFLMARRGCQKRKDAAFADIELIAMDPRPELSTERAADCHRVREVIDSLTERERDVLFARFWNYDPDGGKQSFSSEILADLVERWGTTEDNIRQILCRALKKVKDQLS